MCEVARIQVDVAETLQNENPDINIIKDLECDIIMDLDEAEELLTTSEFEIITFNPSWIGAPRPKKRK